jgi:hypothetical protein
MMPRPVFTHLIPKAALAAPEMLARATLGSRTLKLPSKFSSKHKNLSSIA